MEKKVDNEADLYPGMCSWLNSYLIDQYKNKKCRIIVEDTSQVALDAVLEKYQIIKYFPQTVGTGIQIDVLGMVIFDNSANIYFIEAKKGRFTLRDLGQLLIYCKLCNPEEAWLLTPGSLGTLGKILINMKREDLLDYGTEKTIKKLKVAQWDVTRNAIDYHSLIPKL